MADTTQAVSDPVSPEAMNEANPAVDGKRRGFLRLVFGTVLGWGFAALGAAAALWTAGIARFMFPNTLIEPPQRFKVGWPSQYPAGYVEARFKQQHGIWLVHGTYRGRPQIYALRTVCTHLGCITTWQASEQKFKCPCHGSGFYQDGINFEGPAPRPLDRYAIRIADDGQLEVDKGRTFQEDLGQWDDPASLVAV